jgi:hypothetical protein
VYLELLEPEPTPANGRDAPNELQLCVVAPFSHRCDVDQRGARAPGGRSLRSWLWDDDEPAPVELPDPLGWQYLLTPRLDTWLTPMLGWVEARLRPNTGYAAEEVRAHLSEQRLEDWIKTPGDLLDLLAVIDDAGVGRVFGEQGVKHAALVRAAMRRAAHRAGGKSLADTSSALEKRGASMLMGMEVERLRRGWPPTLTEAEWGELVPRHQAAPIDPKRLHQLLQARTPEALDEATRLVDTSAEAHLGLLTDARVLVDDTSGRLAMRPPWLHRVLTHAAIDKLMDEGPEGVGALLLYEQSSEQAMERLLERASNNELNLLRQCCEDVSEESPERLAALNGAFRALGLCAAAGQPLPEELMGRVWEVQMQYASPPTWSNAPRPRLDLHGDVGAVLADGHSIWPVAALGLSLRLHDASVQVPPGPLNPWAVGLETDVEHLHIGELLRCFPRSPLRSPSAADFLLRVVARRIATCLYDRLGTLGLPGAEWWRLIGPTLLVRRAQGLPTPELPSDQDDTSGLPWGLAALDAACQEEKASLDDVLAWCWSRWCLQPQQSPANYWANERAQPSEHADARRLWSALPATAVTDAVLDILWSVPAAWPTLSDEVWMGWLRRCAERQHVYLSSGLVKAIPIHVGLEAERRGLLDNQFHLFRERLWSEAPEACLALVDDLAPLPPSTSPGGFVPLGMLLEAAPPNQLPALFERARGWCARPSSCPALGVHLKFWLHNLVYARGPHWREAWRLLCVYERAIAEEQARAVTQQRAPDSE